MSRYVWNGEPFEDTVVASLRSEWEIKHIMLNIIQKSSLTLEETMWHVSKDSETNQFCGQVKNLGSVRKESTGKKIFKIQGTDIYLKSIDNWDLNVEIIPYRRSWDGKDVMSYAQLCTMIEHG